MTKTTLLDQENDDFFYESQDIFVSSSCSTSNSDNEDETIHNYNYAPLTLNNYDIWISQPSSISERRNRLLRHLGLAGDTSFSRGKTVHGATNTNNADISTSVSSDQLTRSQKPPPEAEVSSTVASSSAAAMLRSKSDSAADRENCNDNKPCFCSSGSIHSVDNCGGSGSPIKPPLGRNCRKVDQIGSELRYLSLDWSNGLENGDVDENEKRVEEIEVCTIRDLDNGKEFVVKELREDGTWNKVKEVGTGRQLTMEEFEMTVGHSPIVKELMRRQNVEDGKDGGYNNNKDNVNSVTNEGGSAGDSFKSKKKGSWLRSLRSLRSIRSAASSMKGRIRERISSDERDTSSEKGGRRSSSATDDSQDAASFHGSERVRVKQYGKSCKDLTAVYKTQEIQAHNGSIWSIKFSLDGKHLASAGEDCVIHVWQVVESERKGELLTDKPEDANVNMLFVVNGSPDTTTLLSPMKDNNPEKKKKGRSSFNRKSLSLDQLVVSDTVFALTEKPICSFQGHLDDVLDLSWSKSQHLLSSSMDKTVRLWHMSSKSCLKIFSHSDYVTCIQFNPVDDRYFISGSLDAKVRIWSIPDRQVVDWIDLHEMVTAACYTPDGQGALVGSYKGSCHLYNASENKLQQKSQINLQNKKKKSHQKKITGFQFAPGSSSEVLITSADSRIRVVDGVDLVHKFKGFRNATSPISASLTANGKYIVSASEDSHVYIWKNEADCRPNRSKGVIVTHSYEHFHCKDVSLAIPWPGMGDVWDMHSTPPGEQTELDHNDDEASSENHPPSPVVENFDTEGSRSASGYNSPRHGTIASATNSYFFDRISATWPEEKLLAPRNRSSPRVSVEFSNGVSQNMSALGMVIVTAGLRGEIRTFQNFGLPLRI
ncbi:putative transcription factor WD40-like family [Lupinus albus]|uniref:Putative transcription factor WD40-like family n=1 Tax=Lupinus albus TaxID=3870 RepID=A0A6A4NMU5_LUPAL|nr:putative transcription factor WD40-like family [Lupinus albus]